jgi:phage terminase small subunit
MQAQMKRGPPPKPAKILAHRGSSLAKPRLLAEPPAPAGLPVRPDWEPGKALECWDWLVTQLEAMGLLSSADQRVMERYCVMAAEWPTLEPKERIKSAGALLAIEREYGLTPSARARIGIELSGAKRKSASHDPASEFMEAAP